MKTATPEETKKIAADFASTLKGGEVIGLVGELGAGKTTFVQGLAAALGVTERVKSPTFAVMHEYAARNGDIRRILHIDLYRFTNEQDLRALALPDERRPDTVIVIEWPNVVPNNIHVDYTVTFTHEGGDERMITIQ